MVRTLDATPQCHPLPTRRCLVRSSRPSTTMSTSHLARASGGIVLLRTWVPEFVPYHSQSVVVVRWLDDLHERFPGRQVAAMVQARQMEMPGAAGHRTMAWASGRPPQSGRRSAWRRLGDVASLHHPHHTGVQYFAACPADLPGHRQFRRTALVVDCAHAVKWGQDDEIGAT